MFCKNCGKEMGKEDKFCSSCGEQSENEIFKNEPLKNITVEQKPKKKRKGCLISLIIFGVIIVFIIQFGSPDTNNVSNNANNHVLSTEESNVKGLEFDERSWNDFLKLYEAHNKFMLAINTYSNGNASAVDFYDYCKTVKDYFSKASMVFNYGKSNDEKTYLSTFQSLAISDQIAAENLMKYLDSNSVKYLSKANENIQRAKEAATMIAGNRSVLLKKIGLTEEEITEKINQAIADLNAIEEE